MALSIQNAICCEEQDSFFCVLSPQGDAGEFRMAN